MESLRVLVVYQSETRGFEVSRLISSLGHSGTVATSGEEALLFLEALPLDAVLADGALPDMLLLDLIAQARQRWPERPVIVAADADPAATLALLQAQVCAVIPAEVSADWLDLALQRAGQEVELIQLRTTHGEHTVVHQLALHFAHAINNPLSAISGLVQLLLATPNLQDTVREDLLLLAENTQRLSGVVRTLAKTRQVPPRPTDE